MRGYRKDKNPFIRTAKAVGRGLGEMAEAMAEAAREVEERNEIERQIEQEKREVVETALLDYEKHVGYPFRVRYPESLAKVAGVYPADAHVTYSDMPWTVTWSMASPGHLINCQENCRNEHCIVCGDIIYNAVYCRVHKPVKA